MRQTILARRYAKALFSLGKESGKYENYAETLGAMADLYRENVEVESALTNPLFPLEARRKVMTGIASSVKADEVLTRFLELLIDKKRANILPEIADEMLAMVNEAKGISYGMVISAVELSEELRAKVVEALEKLTGKKVTIETTVDPSIIGGIVAKVGDLVLDGSIRTQLTSLKESIKGSE